MLGVDHIVRIDAASEIAGTDEGPVKITLALGETVATLDERRPSNRSFRSTSNIIRALIS